VAEPVMLAATGAGDDDMAGGVNCFGDKDTGSFRLEWDAVVESQPEIIIPDVVWLYSTARAGGCTILAAKPGGTTCRQWTPPDFRHGRQRLHQPLRATFSAGLGNHC